MNTPVHPLGPRLDPSNCRDDAVDLDQLLQDYLALNADALDVLVGLYDAAENGEPLSSEARTFVSRLGEWERKLHLALSQIGNEQRSTQTAVAM